MNFSTCYGVWLSNCFLLVFDFVFPDMWRHHLKGEWSLLQHGNHLGSLTHLCQAQESIQIYQLRLVNVLVLN